MLVKLRAEMQNVSGRMVKSLKYKDYPTIFFDPSWISVNERLPEPFTLVLGYMAWGGYDVLSYENQRFYTPGSFQPLPNEAVTHWMEMPEEPKEEKGEE